MNAIKKNSFITKKYKALLFANLLGWVVTLVGSLSDSILAGILISEEAVCAVELVSPLFNILMFFAVLLALGVSTLFSTYMGAFEKDKAARINGMGLIIAITGGIISAVLMFVLKDAFFSFYNSSESIRLLAEEYYSCFYILAFSYPLYWLVYYLVATDGDSGAVLSCDIITAFSNPILSVFLVKDFGIKGLGYGTVISNFISIIFLAIHFFKKSNSIKFKIAFSKKELATVCAIGSSVSLGQIYLAIVNMALNKIIITRFGSEYLAAYAVINIILTFGGCFSCAIDAAGPFITVAYGEKNPVVQQRVLKLASKYSILLGIAFNIAELLLAGVLPTLYGISNPEVFAAALYAGRVLAFMNIALALVVEMMSYYPRINQSLLGNCYTLVYSLIAPLALPIPLAFAGGFKGLVWGFFLTPFVTLLFGFIFVAAKYGKKMYPFMIEESADKIFVSEIEVNEKDIMALTSSVKENLESCGVSPSIINEIQLMIEETFMIVKEKNSKKTILADCSLIVSDESVRLITRDNGIVFDITDVDAKIHSLREYTAAMLIERNSGAEYLTTISFNRNSFLWER